MSGFKKFLLRGNVVDLAVAVIVGAAFGAVVTAFTGGFITPLIAAIGGKANFASLHFTVNHSQFRYGLFLNALISFVIIAAVVYFFVVLPINTLMSGSSRRRKSRRRSRTARNACRRSRPLPASARSALPCKAPDRN